jgi:DNA-binding GntR family transcriptional regulator
MKAIAAEDVAHYQSRTLVEVAYKALKSDITRCVLAPGKKIVIRELSERYGVSETPIKQALNRLVSEGLVESIPRRGMKVRLVEWAELEETLDIRYMIESYSIKNAIARLREHPETFDQFDTLIREHEAVTRNIADIDEYYRNYNIDAEFHRLFVAAAGNRKTARIYAGLDTHGYRYYVFGKQQLSEMLAGVEEHKAILDALKAFDAAETEKWVKIHIENAKAKLHAAFLANQGERRD